MAKESIREFRKNLRAIEREIERRLKDETSCCGVTPAQCHALLEIAESGTVSLVDLSEKLKLDNSTLSRTVDGLVKAGYVDRAIDARNRRYVRLKLTDAGQAKVDFIDRTCDRFYAELMDPLPASRKRTVAEAARLLAGVFTGTACGCGGNGRCCAPAGNSKETRRGHQS